MVTAKTFGFWLAEALHWLLLGGAILLLLYIEIVQRFILHEAHLENYERPFTLILLVLLSLALATERYGRFGKIDRQFERIAGAVENAMPARLLTDKEVGSEALRLVRAAERTIKALIYEEQPSQSRTISQEIAIHMASRKNVKFEMVLVADLTSVNEEFWRIHAERFDEYRKRGIEDHFVRYILDSKTPVGLDVLIVDDDHFGIAFSRLPRLKEQPKELAIRFWQQPAITRLVGEWFDRLTKEGIAVRYEVAEQKYRQDQVS